VLLRSDCHFAPPPNLLTAARSFGMKVKFLKNGRWAHSNIHRGQFDFKNGEIVGNISEEDAKTMADNEIVEILGHDTEDEPESEPEENGELEHDENGDDEIIPTKSSVAGEGSNISTAKAPPWKSK